MSSTTTTTRSAAEIPSDHEKESALDPRDWPRFRRLAHELLDQALDLHQHVREQPVWRPVPSEVETVFQQPPPRTGAPAEEVARLFSEHVAPYRTGNLHPRFWGWVSGTGSPMGLVAEMLAGGMNSISGLFNDSAARIENQVIEWMKEVMGFPTAASGILTSGGSVANLVGLAVGRDVRAGWNVPREGLAGERRLVFYASEEVHSSVDKAAMLLGLGRQSLRRIPVDEDYRLRLPELLTAIARDRAAGYQPFAVVASAGTVNTGAIDDLEGLAEIARDQGLWLHVDGAFGAAAMLSSDLRRRVSGLELADSVAFDFHKWFYVPYEAGCVLVRDGELHRASFSVPAAYLEPPERGIGAQPDSTNLRGLQLSRGFKALKVWMCLKQQGLDRIAACVERNVRQADELARRIDADRELERLAPVELNVVCFRFHPPEADPARLDDLNREVLARLHEQGLAAPSSTTLGGRFALRAAIANHRTRSDDLEALCHQTRRLGQQILEETTV